ncbi:MAG: hypothetical protein QXE37_02240 [Nitrososphaerales archaeon]
MWLWLVSNLTKEIHTLANPKTKHEREKVMRRLNDNSSKIGQTLN